MNQTTDTQREPVSCDDTVIQQTRNWVDSVIIQHNFCPFAAREFTNDRIHYQVIRDTAIESCLEQLIDSCIQLDAQQDIETTLVIYPDTFKDFESFLGFVAISEQLLIEQAYEGVYQLASFHPDYCFDGSHQDDAANFTNRSLYPMLHILREESIERALESCPEPELIPQRNVQYARTMGITAMQAALDKCRHSSR